MLVLAMQFSKGADGVVDTPALCGSGHEQSSSERGRERREERVLTHSLKTEQRATTRVRRRRRARELHPTPASRCRVTSAPTGNPSPRSGRTTERSGEALFRAGLLRKEVIQPHLPVRLPCYDFTPIANPTFDSSLPEGLGHWLRVLPTFVV
jgi:hypothetical protein